MLHHLALVDTFELIQTGLSLRGINGFAHPATPVATHVEQSAPPGLGRPSMWLLAAIA